MLLKGFMALSHLFNCQNGPSGEVLGQGAFRNGFRRVFHRFCRGFGGRGKMGAEGMDLALPWSPLDLETNEKLPYDNSK